MEKFDIQEHTRFVTTVRANAIEFIVVALGLALGVNLLAGGVALWLSISGAYLALVGVLIVLFSGLVLVLRIIPNRSRITVIGTVLPVDPKQEVCVVDRYDFVESVERYIRALTVENKALGRAWRETSLSGVEVSQGNQSVVPLTRYISRDTASMKLLREAAEYYILDRLSTHLTDYFNQVSKELVPNLCKLERHDVPSVLLQNRFLELFSRSLDERDVFSKTGDSDEEYPEPFEGIVYSVYGGNGAIYDKFELVLPAGTVVTRNAAGNVDIKTSRFRIEFKTDFGGFSSVLPREFEELYLGKKFGDVSTYKLNLVVKVKFGLLAFVSKGGWEYYRWLDSFLADLVSDASFERFLDRIGWESGLTTAMVMRANSRPENSHHAN